MNFEFSANSLDNISADAIIVFAFEGEDKKNSSFVPLGSFEYLDKKFKNAIFQSAKFAYFTGKRGEIFTFYPQQKFLAKEIIIVGLGKKSEFTADDLRRAMGKVSKTLKDKVDSLAISLPEETKTNYLVLSQVVAEGILLGCYDFNKYKSKNETKSRKLSAVIISQKNKSLILQAKQGIERGRAYSKATVLARDLVNEQSAIATPTYLANLALDIAKKDKKHISCKIYNKEEAQRLGMEAFLGIARASDTPPKFIHLEYIPDKKNSKEKLALVGKGITFDSGGINVKTGDSMVDMKMDMSGAAIVLAVFSVISAIKPNFPVIGLIAATPNLISGKSLVPGDIVKALNGKTIEILNTDAEGRVTLADSLSFAVKQGATKIIDFATLTGSVMAALGTEITGLFSNNKDLADAIKKSASDAGEKIWELPLEKDYREANKSDVADIANIPNTRYGGSLTAALFLEEFVSNKPWAHLDIAGTAFSAKGTDISPKGGTGYGVRTVLNLLS